MGKGRTVREIVTEQVIKGLEKGNIPWVRPWQGAEAKNFVTGHRYTGVNTLLAAVYCEEFGYKLPLFASYKQIERAGGHVNRGEHGHVIVFTKRDYVEVEVENDDGETEIKLKPRYVLRYYTNFNIEQTDLDVNKYAKLAEHKPNFVAEELLHRRQPTIKHGGSRASYDRIADRISLPVPESFNRFDEYYLTAFHELTHWTGHESRLSRLEPSWFGDDKYSLEELVAEIGANMLAFESGIEQGVRDNSQAYINHWLKVLRGDSKAILKASTRAQKAFDYCCNGQADEEIPEEAEGGTSLAKPENVITVPETGLVLA